MIVDETRETFTALDHVARGVERRILVTDHAHDLDGRAYRRERIAKIVHQRREEQTLRFRAWAF